MFKDMKCPVCGNLDYDCVDMDTQFNDDEVTFRWLCWCDKCKADFDIFSTYTHKATECRVVDE